MTTEVKSATNYAFVMNILDLDTPIHTLAPGHQLRRANSAEVVAIERTLEGETLKSLFPFSSLWKQSWPQPAGAINILPMEKWRYFVIAFEGRNGTVDDLQSAFDLAPVELEIAFTVVNILNDERPGAVIFNPRRLFHILEDAGFSDDFFVRISTSDLDLVSQIHSALKNHDNNLIDIKRLAKQIGQLKALPHNSPLRFLGYFAILESLLTHTPKPTDPYDSITRQVKKKIALLNRRFDRPLDYSSFMGATADTVWSKMYNYRSILAHGGISDFKAELECLGNHENALDLLRETVKSVIRQALAEPYLLLDLREC